MAAKIETDDRVAFTTQELLAEYYEILDLANNYRQIGVPSMWTELKQRLEDAYARETVHGGLVQVGRATKEAGKKTQERKDPSDGGENYCREQPVSRPAEGKLPVAGHLRSEKLGAEVPQLVDIRKMAEKASVWAPTQPVPNAYDLIESLVVHIQRLMARNDLV